MTSRTELLRRAGIAVAAVFAALVLGVLAVETARIVQARIATVLAPILAAALGITLCALLVWFLWHVLRDPTKRLAERTRDQLDYRLQRTRAAQELERRVAALEEELQVRALAASARVHESASRAVSDARLRLELEELKGRSEEIVRRAQSVEIARLIARYEAAHLRLDDAPSLTPAEKAQLLEDLRAMLAEDAAALPAERSTA